MVPSRASSTATPANWWPRSWACATLVGFVFTFSFVLNWALDIILGQRVSAETEVAGLDLPEMGQLGYPEFVFRPEPDVMAAAERVAMATA